MSRWQRRYEVLLPLHFNDGHAVPDDLIAQTLLELEQRFRAISCETQVIQGMWENKGQTYRDELVRVFVDVADNQENRRFFVRCKKQLKKRFRQLEIRMTGLVQKTAMSGNTWSKRRSDPGDGHKVMVKP